MFLCNAVGILLLFFIAFFHLIGVDKENNGEVIDTNQVSTEKKTTVTSSGKAVK